MAASPWPTGPTWASILRIPKLIYIPVPNVNTGNARPGGVQVISTANGNITGTLPVPGARYVALSPDGKTLLVFASNSDTMFMVNLTATPLSAVAITGFAGAGKRLLQQRQHHRLRPELRTGVRIDRRNAVGHAFRYCVAESYGDGSGRRRQRGSAEQHNLYVAGYPGGNTGTFDVVDVSAMTRTTANPVVIGDGRHTTMALSNNNKLYIGAVSCANTSVGCLSIVDLGQSCRRSPDVSAWRSHGTSVHTQPQHDVRGRRRRPVHLRHHHRATAIHADCLCRCVVLASCRSTSRIRPDCRQEWAALRPPILFAPSCAGNQLLRAEASTDAAQTSPPPPARTAA